MTGVNVPRTRTVPPRAGSDTASLSRTQRLVLRTLARADGQGVSDRPGSLTLREIAANLETPGGNTPNISYALTQLLIRRLASYDDGKYLITDAGWNRVQRTRPPLERKPR